MKKKPSKFEANPYSYDIAFPSQSKWGVQIGGDPAINRPLAGKEPNWFQRLMQTLILGVKWKKFKE